MAASLACRWRGFHACWPRRPNSARNTRSAAAASAFTGLTSTRTSRSPACSREQTGLRNKTRFQVLKDAFWRARAPAEPQTESMFSWDPARRDLAETYRCAPEHRAVGLDADALGAGRGGVPRARHDQANPS